jgi:myxalamid-type polyketide synthase MxaE and MxaD
VNQSVSSVSREPIAIIGIGCRFPGASDPQAFWHLMYHGIDAIREVPADRYNIDAFYDPHPATPGKVMSRYGGFLEQVDQFDAEFFGVSPRKAAKTDPQHRLLMEVAWEAMEDAGLVPATMTEQEKLDIACFIGIMTSDYWDRQFRNVANLDLYAAIGSNRSGAAGHLSFSLDLKGTSFAIDAACSSSLVAVDQAVHTLRSGACTTALAGGVNIILNPDHTISFSQSRVMAADGHCKTFDAAADGYVRSEGAGIVVLKLLSRAQADGDRIYAVIRGSASSNDGRSDSFMTPNIKGQQAGLRKACLNAGVDPHSIDYVEAHGPGTQAGDPVEITALGNVLCQHRSEANPLLVGSVKTNIGHMESSAGVAGLIKAVLCLRHRVIPPNLHFHQPSPAIRWQDYALKIPTELTPWPSSSTPRRAVVCSYGITGTNTYVIVEEAPPLPAPQKQEPLPSTILLPLSARTPKALNDLARRYIEHLEKEEYVGQPLYDVCYTASTRRTHHEYRLAVVSSSKQDACEQLKAYLQGKTGLRLASGHIADNRARKMAWVFPGQGSQWLGMGRDLLEQESVFRTTIEHCDQLIRHYVGWSLIEQLQADEEQSRLHEINVVQPTLFAIEVALAALWRSWGIVPDAVIGHSMGEIAAAYVAGVLSLHDATWIICKRSELLLRTSGKGAMASVELTLEQATMLVSDYPGCVSVAVSNSPNSTVLSGDPDALTEILAVLEQQGIFGRLVKVDVASHSPQMDPLRDELLRLLECVKPHQNVIPIYSTVNGNIVNGSDCTAQYWANNLRQPVLFLATTQRLLEDGFTTFMEISPHPILVGALRQTIETSQQSGLILASMQRNEAGQATMLAALGQLYVQGYQCNWAALYLVKGQPVSLPAYPWQRQRYWDDKIDAPHASTRAVLQANGALIHPMLGSGTPAALHPPKTTLWTTTIAPSSFPFLDDHRIHGVSVLPGAAYIELALAAATEVFGAHHFEIEELQLQKALFFSKDLAPTLQVILMPEDGVMTLRFFSAQLGQQSQDASWVQHASARIRYLAEPLAQQGGQLPSSDQLQSQWTLAMEAPEYYADLRTHGTQYGPLFQGVTHVWRRPSEVLARISVPEAIQDDMAGYQIHPALMDAFLQGITPFLPRETCVPVAVKRIRFYRRPQPGHLLWTHARIQPHDHSDQGFLEGNVSLLDTQGHLLIEVQGLLVQSLESCTTHDFLRQRLHQLLYAIEWEQQDRRTAAEHEKLRKHWLIFSDRDGLGVQLAAHLRAKGAHCTLVIPSTVYQCISEQQYELSPTDPEQFHQIVKAWSAQYDEQTAGIVYLWGQQSASPVNEQSTLHMVYTDLEMTCIGLLYLLQALTAVKRATAPRLWLVTSGVHAIEGSDRTTGLSQAPLWGLGRVIVYEYQHLRCCLIDLDTMQAERRVDMLFNEIWSDDDADEVALRGERRYVARLTRRTLPDEWEQAEALFRVDGTYLVTGGLSGIGLRTAQWMVDQGARHLVLMGRRGATEEAQAPLQAMRARGAAVRVMQVDVAQELQLASALAQIRHEMPPLRGVFHSAVVLDDSILDRMTRERFLGVMPPKVDGPWNLHRLTLEDPLDYFVLFSSTASMIGSPGQGNYAAASVFMDTLAHYRRQQGYPALAINWGRWGEVGQATKEKRGERLDSRGSASMKPQEALAVLASLLRQSPPQVGVMSFNLRKWSQFYPNLIKSSLFTRLVEEAEVQEESEVSRLHVTRDQLCKLDGEQRQQVVAQYLSDQVARVLGHASLTLDAQQRINRLGIDSLMSVELKSRIASDLNVMIPTVTFLKGVTFEELIAQVLAQLV